jgi:2-polyprenyl-6-methoxyphenol hydroxylase-like FAD-dependent oxidoreductase
LKNKIRIAILGGGPSALFLFKRFVDAAKTDVAITIFERGKQLGAGMPYSADGANDEHITNVSGNEIPPLVTSVTDWIKTVQRDTLNKFHIDPEKFNEYKVLPRLLFGQYLTAQFALLQQQAKDAGLDYQIHFDCPVTDIIDYSDQNVTVIEIAGKTTFEFDHVAICTGHTWPVRNEGEIPGYFDSPYPPVKLGLKLNHPVALKGAALTAIDAIRTLSRHNGTYQKNEEGKVSYTLMDDSAGFKLVMHSREGLLPALRFHLEDSHLSKDATLSPEEIKRNMADNDGFLSLDYVFEKDFKDAFKDKRPGFYNQIKGMSLEEFVAAMMDLRENVEPFHLLRAEYIEAEQSIKRHESVYWKEMLAILSFAMNYPAKHFSAEDMMRLQKTLMPLISIVIAFVPQSSAEEMLALHQAGLLELITVGDDSTVEPVETGGIIYHYKDEAGKSQSPHYQTFVDCVGQPHLAFEDLPYKSLLQKQTVSPAKLAFKNAGKAIAEHRQGNKAVETDGKGNWYLKVPGIAINDNFQVVDNYGALNPRVYMMAVPYIGGYNPDYSGLDFCEAASATIIKSLFDDVKVV